MDFSEKVLKAIQLSIFSRIRKESYEPLFQRGRIVKFSAGEVIHQAFEEATYAGLVLSGFFRLYLSSPSGRQATVRYARTGEVMGLVGALANRGTIKESDDTYVQALSDSEVFAISFRDIKEYGKRSPELSWIFAEECASRVYSVLRELYGVAFTSVRERLARHLLLTAVSQSEPPFLSVRMSQQDLADSIGTVREVIVRELRALKAAGLVSSTGSKIEILNAEALLGLFEENN
ncbi:Crp-like helix-turn-helix domain protein [Leptospira fainei serovar Hurstbridge str. BUT 6]|uniref:Crp-like helix-turn-helix domain protein n=1 Tax=Leptospira fainei serovar Hurstbridge str. BUT 6 TaxID=1193011 RepID=S3VW83_9LEPT|nr:Crp/Fnr family transcriptional regulator [Leptospira fainei]EPG72397.1 Crp-like helix-turn-helix domain protein [Leptospira fainei serovar Hurstbridge str. BUT 6]